ncbi:hypothetical protein [Litorihabitans aurantiacus]|uniref:hypothetical protein n=1 Tax=Litorihabitans aurantiacus TaxID=1930061 RepID=UPI0024E0833E|nr:hypothetical protein [Litorihabitans aurantiacus]
MQELSRFEPALLPRYHQDDRGWSNRTRGFHQLAKPGAYGHIHTWHGRDDWLDVVVPLVCQLRREVLRKHSVGLDFMLRWAAAKSAYAHRRTGRRCIVRPKILAGTLSCEERQVKRANAAARELGLEVVVLRGRMLNQEESYACRRRGSRQRGLASEVALTVPPAARAAIAQARASRSSQVSTNGASCPCSVDSDTPTSGHLRDHLPHLRRHHPCACGTKKDGAARRSPDRRGRRTSEVLRLAQEVTRVIPWLRGESPRRLLGALRPFSVSSAPWTAADIQFAMGAQAHRAGRRAYLTRYQTKVPWALLRHVLAQIDPYADHPRLPEIEENRWTQRIDADPCDTPDCDGHGWHNTSAGATPCPAAR